MAFETVSPNARSIAVTHSYGQDSHSRLCAEPSSAASPGCEASVKGTKEYDYYVSRRDFALLYNSLLPILDFASLLFAGQLAAVAYASPGLSASVSRPDLTLILVLSTLAPAVLYDKRFVSVASRRHIGALARCYLTGFLLFVIGVMGIAAIGGVLDTVAPQILGLWLGAALALTAMTRVLLTLIVQYFARLGVLTEVIAIVGAGPRADRLVQYLGSVKPLAPKVLGVFDDTPPPALLLVSDSPAATDVSSPVSDNSVAGSIDDLLTLGKTQRIDWVFLTPRRSSEDAIPAIVHRLKALSVPVGLCPLTAEGELAGRHVEYLGGMPVTLLQYPSRGWHNVLRSVGQFLPRWISTLLSIALTFAASLARHAQLRFARWRTADIAPGASPLVCALDDYDLKAFSDVVHHFGQHRFGFVVTPNVDHFIRLHDNPAFRELYAAANYVLLDSRFLAKLLRLVGGSRLPVCTGSDLTAKLLANSIGPTDRLLIVGGSEQQAQQLRQRFGLENLAHYNPPMGFIRDQDAVTACLEFIEAHSPFRYCLLAVGSPQQEILAQQLQARGVARGLALCVGASIDFLTGAERRAPLWMQQRGVEWLYRLLHNPGRLAKRYLIRGPRIFWLLRKTKFVLRAQRTVEVVATTAKAA